MAFNPNKNDLALLASIAEHEVLTVGQLSALSQRSRQVLRRRLRILESEGIIAAIADILRQCPGASFEVSGHTDSQGDDQYNQGLSERRAQAVADYLVSHGANAGNLTVKGYGESHPVADNGTEGGRAANRRVELRH